MNIELNDLDNDISFEDFLEKCGVENKIAKSISKKTINISSFINILDEQYLDELLKEMEYDNSVIGNLNNIFSDIDFFLLVDEMESGGFKIFEDSIVYALSDIIESLQNSEENRIFTLKNLRICITGTLSRPRKYFETFIKENKGVFQTAVTNTTDILIYSNNDGKGTTKYNKAIDLKKRGFNIKMMTEKDFHEFTKELS